MKKICTDLKKYVTKIINSEKKEILPMTDKENESYISSITVWQICRKEFDYNNDVQVYCKVRDHCYYTRKYCENARGIGNLRYQILKKILQSFIMVLIMTVTLESKS